MDGLPQPQSLAPCTPRLAGLWLVRRLRRFRTSGASMAPNLLPGQSVLVDGRAFRAAPPAVGDVVLLQHPFDPGLLLLKRVRSVEAGRTFVVGDNLEASTDSRSFGAVPLEQVLGRVVCTFP